MMRKARKYINCIDFVIPDNFIIEKYNIKKPIYFHRAIFKGTCTFKETAFGGNVVFNDVKFLDLVHFSIVKFNKETLFNDVQFNNKVFFIGKPNSENEKEKNTTFKGTTVFYRTNFDKDVDFSGSKFEVNEKNKLKVTHSNFKEIVRFDCSEYKELMFPSPYQFKKLKDSFSN